MPTEDNFRLSPSEKLTLRHIAEGELHPRELDWLALETPEAGRIAPGAAAGPEDDG